MESNSPGLSVLLHDVGDASHELHGGYDLVVHGDVLLVELARVLDEQPVVGSHAAVHHADVLGDRLDLAYAALVVQRRLVLLLRGQDHTVRS